MKNLTTNNILNNNRKLRIELFPDELCVALCNDVYFTGENDCKSCLLVDQNKCIKSVKTKKKLLSRIQMRTNTTTKKS